MNTMMIATACAFALWLLGAMLVYRFDRMMFGDALRVDGRRIKGYALWPYYAALEATRAIAPARRGKDDRRQ